MKKALIILAVLVAVALIWEQIPAAREVTVDDYATDQHGSYLARWGVYYYEVIGTDTTLVDMDTTDSYGAYEITAPTGSYLIYAFPLWDDSTDTSLSRKSFMNKQTIVAVANDTTFLRFVKADSGFIGTVQGNIATADSAAVAHRAHTAVKFDASDSATFGGHAQHNATLNVGADGTGHDVNYYGDSTGTRLFWDASKSALRVGRGEGGVWDPDSIGLVSLAGGGNSMASGDRSFSWGCDSRATGFASTATGYSHAGGNWSFAAVTGRTYDNYCVAIGQTACATGLYSTAIGQNSTTDGNQSMALGSGVRATGVHSTAIGQYSAVDGDESMALGIYVSADTNNAMVIGRGLNSFHKLENNTPYSLIIGMNSTIPTVTIVDDTVTVDSVVVITGDINVGGNAAITGDISCDDLAVTDSATFGGHAQHNSTITVGVDGAGYDINCYGDSTGSRLFWDEDKMAFRIGRVVGTHWDPDSIGFYSFAGGYNNKAIGKMSFVGGGQLGIASGFCATVMGGEDNSATASYATVSGGDHNVATGAHASIAGGQTNYATGTHCYVGGGNADSATGAYATVSGGILNRAAGTSSTVPGGDRNKAHGAYSFAGGRRMRVNGDYSFGWGLKGGLTGDDIIVDSSYVFVIKGAAEDYKVGINTVSPEEALHVSGDIKADTVHAAVQGNTVGDLTGTASLWAGSGVVDDSLTALTTDIAALQATKVDTNEAYVHRDAIDWTPESQLNASILKGNASAPWYSPTDTVVVDRFWVNYYGSAAGGEWEIILLNTSGDTISWTDTLTASGWQGYDDQSPSNTIITPADGFYLDVNKISGTTNLTRPSFRVEFYYTNP